MTKKRTRRRFTKEFKQEAVRLCERKPAAGLLVHTDRGVQHASSVFRSILKDGSYRLSMSRNGNCWDNAMVESFFGRFKVEAIHGEIFRTRRELELEVFDHIENVSNKRRKHSTLECLSPQMYEQKYYEAQAA